MVKNTVKQTPEDRLMPPASLRGDDHHNTPQNPIETSQAGIISGNLINGE